MVCLYNTLLLLYCNANRQQADKCKTFSFCHPLTYCDPVYRTRISCLLFLAEQYQ